MARFVFRAHIDIDQSIGSGPTDRPFECSLETTEIATEQLLQLDVVTIGLGHRHSEQTTVAVGGPVVALKTIENTLEIREGIVARISQSTTNSRDDVIDVMLDRSQVEIAFTTEGVVETLPADAERRFELADRRAVVAVTPKEIARALEDDIGVELLTGARLHDDMFVNLNRSFKDRSSIANACVRQAGRTSIRIRDKIGGVDPCFVLRRSPRVMPAKIVRFVIAIVMCLTTSLTFVGCRASKNDSNTDSRPLRVVSYNIKHGLGMDGVLDLDRVADVLRRLRPDVVLLQEVDEKTKRSGGLDQAAYLGKTLGMTPSFAPFMDYDGGRYGLATLSRFPVRKAEVVVLPPGKREPRSALIVTVDVHGLTVRVANAHFDWLADDTERLAQAHELREALADVNARDHPVVLGGDLNDVPASRTLKLLSEARADGAMRLVGPTVATFPSDEPIETIDHFLTGTSDRWKTHRVFVEAETVASDHRPVVADFEIDMR